MRRMELPPENDDRKELHRCPKLDCESELVYPLPDTWENIGRHNGSSGWKVICRCPECGWHGEGQHSEESVSNLDEVLDKGHYALIEGFKEWDLENMKSEIELFARALRAGDILPEDF